MSGILTRRGALAASRRRNATVALSWTRFATGAVAAGGTLAVSADSFVDSIGVNTHVNYLDQQYVDRTQTTAMLAEAGIRHTRTSWDPSATYAADWVKSASAAIPGGMKVCKIHDSRYPGTIQEHLDSIKTNGLVPYISYIEGPNEWDNYNLAGINAYMVSLANTFGADAATAGLKIAAASIADWRNGSKYQTVGNLDGYIDVANVHDYPGGVFMSDSQMDTAFTNGGYNLSTRPLPLIATETMYSTKVTATDAGHPPVAETQDGILTLRSYFEHFRRGYERTYKYQFLDSVNDNAWESGFGMVRYDWSRKPSFTAVKNTIALMSDLGPAFTPGRLDYTLSGTNAATRQQLFQKRNGEFWLAVHQAVEIWNINTLQPISPAPADVSVTLNLVTPAATVQTFHPDASQTVQLSGANVSSFNLPSKSQMTLVRIVP